MFSDDRVSLSTSSFMDGSFWIPIFTKEQDLIIARSFYGEITSKSWAYTYL